jgi:hypothetical protein
VAADATAGILGAMSPCREACERAGEPLAGSYGPLAAWVGISWPKPLWDPEEALQSEGLPPALGELAEQFAKTGGKLAVRLFQRSARPGTERVELVLWRPGGGCRRDALRPDELAPVLGRFLQGDPLTGEPLGTELFVCTDGRHDACCAQHGRPVYEALQRAAAAAGAPLRLAECSHLGGHRFAANCLSLPDGRMYGRVTPADAPALLAAARSGEPYLPRLRGNLAGDPLESVAAAFLAEHCARSALSWQLDGPPQRDASGSRVPVRLRGADGERRAFVRCVTRSYSAPTSCGEPSSETARWIATALES